MKGLTGPKAVARLERRGGRIRVYREDYTSQVDFSLISGHGGLDEVVGESLPDASRAYGPRRFVLSSDAVRADLASEMERLRDLANTDLHRVETTYELQHWDFFSDAGFGQFGCLFAFPGVVVGLAIGLVASQLTFDHVEIVSVLVAPIAGVVLASASLGPILNVAYLSKAVRDRIDIVGLGWMAVVSGILTIVVTVIMARFRIPG